MSQPRVQLTDCRRHTLLDYALCDWGAYEHQLECARLEQLHKYDIHDISFYSYKMYVTAVGHRFLQVCVGCMRHTYQSCITTRTCARHSF